MAYVQTVLPSVRLHSDLERRAELARFLKGFNRRLCLKSIGDETIRRWIVAFGVILISTGLILATASNSKETRQKSVLAEKTDRGWSVAADLAKDETFVVELRPPTSWAEGYFDPDDTAPGGATLYGLINISNPHGGATQFIIHYYSNQELMRLLIWRINVTQQHEGLDTTPLYIEKSKIYSAIGGIAKYSGTYNATIAAIYPPRDEAPFIGIYKKDTVTEYPYTSFLPAGAVTTAAGLGISLFGLKEPLSKPTPKRKRAQEKFHGNRKNQ